MARWKIVAIDESEHRMPSLAHALVEVNIIARFQSHFAISAGPVSRSGTSTSAVDGKPALTRKRRHRHQRGIAAGNHSSPSS